MSDLLKIVSSQYKHLPKYDADFINSRVIKGGSVLKNEPFSFQALYKNNGEVFYEPVSVWVDTELPIKAWRVDYVAISNIPIISKKNSYEEYESIEDGVFPDILTSRPSKPEIVSQQSPYSYDFYFEKGVQATLNAASDKYQSVWFTVNPNGKTLKAGEYKIKVCMTSLDSNKVISEESLIIKVINESLPKMDFCYTNWFHVDCICDTFSVKPYSSAFYKIFDKYLKNMVEHSQNTLLLPAFTPPLDTAIGDERMNVQLVEIDNIQGKWIFNFDKMRKFIHRAKKMGIEFFEHSHIFSQWGAKNAPNIYDVNGKRIFGYDTISLSDEYINFLRAYLVEFIKFVKEENLDSKVIMHLSDEPSLKDIDNYRTVYKKISDLLGCFTVCDAMSSACFYEEGLVDEPILSITSLNDYNEKKCPNIWIYYTGGEEGVTGRRIPHTSATTRVLGVIMYKYKAKGFLQWAYNYYYDRLSHGLYNPNSNANAYKQLNGITYLAYFSCAKNEIFIEPSIREKLMCEAMNDYRALKLLESKIGREKTLSIIEEYLGEINLYTIPKEEEIFKLREIINNKISM